MTALILSTGGLLAALDADEPGHDAARAAVDAADDLVLSPFVLTELDHLVRLRAGRRAQLALLAQVDSGAYSLAPFDAADIAAARDVCERYGDLEVRLTDASLVVLADRHDTDLLLTFDEHPFRAIRRNGSPFRLLPGDS